METAAKQLPCYNLGKLVSKHLILEAMSFAFNSIQATEYLFHTSHMFRKLIALNKIVLSNIFKVSDDEILYVNMGRGFVELFNKSIQQRNLEVVLDDFEDLMILRLFLGKIKLNINQITIYCINFFSRMT